MGKHNDWKNRPEEGKCRPTPEQVKRGAWRLVDTEDAGIRYAFNEQPDPLSEIYAEGNITARQYEAGGHFEKAARGSGMGSPSQRSCLDFTPVGFQDNEDEDIEAQRTWRNLCTMMDYTVQRELLRVCWEKPENNACQHLGRLRLGLDIVADFFKIPEGE